MLPPGLRELIFRRMPFLLELSPSDPCLFGGGCVLGDPQLCCCPDVVCKDRPIPCSRQVASGSVVQDWNSQVPSWSCRSDLSPAVSAQQHLHSFCVVCRLPLSPAISDWVIGDNIVKDQLITFEILHYSEMFSLWVYQK